MKILKKSLLIASIFTMALSSVAVNAQDIETTSTTSNVVLAEDGVVITEGDITDLSTDKMARGITEKYLSGTKANGGVDETTFRHYGPYSSRLYLVNTGDHGFEYKITLPGGSVIKGTLNPGKSIQKNFNYSSYGPNQMSDGIGYVAIAGINGLACKATMRYNILEM